MTDVSNVTWEEPKPAVAAKLALHALPEDPGATLPSWMGSRATIPQVVAWIRALPEGAASEFWSLANDLPPGPWSWLAAAHARTPAERLVAHVKAQPEEVRLAVLNGAFGGSQTAAIVAEERAVLRKRAEDAERIARETEELRCSAHLAYQTEMDRLQRRIIVSEDETTRQERRAAELEGKLLELESRSKQAVCECASGVAEAVVKALDNPRAKGPVCQLDEMAEKLRVAEERVRVLRDQVRDLGDALIARGEQFASASGASDKWFKSYQVAARDCGLERKRAEEAEGRLRCSEAAHTIAGLRADNDLANGRVARLEAALAQQTERVEAAKRELGREG